MQYQSLITKDQLLMLHVHIFAMCLYKWLIVLDKDWNDLFHLCYSEELTPSESKFKAKRGEKK